MADPEDDNTNLHSPRFRMKRDQFIKELDQMFAVFGNPTPKSTVDLEAQLFEGVLTQKHYILMAKRLVRTLLEMAPLARRVEPPVPHTAQQRCDGATTASCIPRRGSKRTASAMEEPAESARPSPAVNFGNVPLSVLSRRYVPVSSSHRGNVGDEAQTSGAAAKSVKVVTRIAHEELAKAETFDVTMMFQVPKGYGIKNVKVTLQKDPV